jgi:hypothetical protein
MSLDCLRRFVQEGGFLIFAGRLPAAVCRRHGGESAKVRRNGIIPTARERRPDFEGLRLFCVCRPRGADPAGAGSIFALHFLALRTEHWETTKNGGAP